MPSYPLFIQASIMNNNAAHQIQKGNYTDSIKCLSQALATIRECIRSDETKVFFQNQQQQDLMETDMRDRTPEHALVQVSSHPLQGNADGEESLLYFYTSPFLLEQEEDILLRCPTCIELISHVIILNLGLVHHLSAFTRVANNPEAHLRRAVAFYSHAQSLAHVHEFDLDALHTLALVNNMGHAHHFLKDDSSALTCFQRLLSAIVFFNDHNELAKQQLNDLTVDGFMLNILTMLKMGSCSAAPAA